MISSSYFTAVLAMVVFTIVVAAEPAMPEAEAEYYHRPYPRYEEHDYPPYHGKPTVVAGACATKYERFEAETIANATSEYFYAQSSCLIGIANGTIPEGYTYKVGGSCSIECDDFADYDDFLSSYTDLVVGDETQIGGSLFCGATATPDYTPDNCKIVSEVYCCKPIASHGYMSREEARMQADAEGKLYKQQLELKALKKAGKRVKPEN